MVGLRALVRIISLTALLLLVPAAETYALTSSSFEANATEVGGNIYGSMVSDSSTFESVSELCLFCDRNFSTSFENQEGVIGAFSGQAEIPVVPQRPESSPYRPLTPYCGDAHVNQASEECDDGNRMDGDGCSRTCQIEGEADVEPTYPAPITGGGEEPGEEPEPSEEPGEEPAEEPAEEPPEEPVLEPEVEEPSKPVIAIKPPKRRWDPEDLIEEASPKPAAKPAAKPIVRPEPEPEFITETPSVISEEEKIEIAMPAPTIIDEQAISHFPADLIAKKVFCEHYLAPYCPLEERITVYTRPLHSSFVLDGYIFFPYLMTALRLLLAVFVALCLILLSCRRDE